MEVRALVAVQGQMHNANRQRHQPKAYFIADSTPAREPQFPGYTGINISPPRTAEGSLNTNSRMGTATEFDLHNKRSQTAGTNITGLNGRSPRARSHMHVTPNNNEEDIRIMDKGMLLRSDGSATPLNDAYLQYSAQKNCCYHIQNGVLSTSSVSGNHQEHHHLAHTSGGDSRTNDQQKLPEASAMANELNGENLDQSKMIITDKNQHAYSPITIGHVGSPSLFSQNKNNCTKRRGSLCSQGAAVKPFNSVVANEQYPMGSKPQFDDLFIGGESIREKNPTPILNQPNFANPQLQLIKTVCQTKNSFLPNFKTKKKEYIFGEHKLSIAADSSQPHSKRQSPTANQTGLTDDFVGALDNRYINSSPDSRSQSPKEIIELNSADIAYLQKLEKLVKHKHKLSSLIQSTISKAHKQQIKAMHILKQQQQQKALLQNQETQEYDEQQRTCNPSYDENVFYFRLPQPEQTIQQPNSPGTEPFKGSVENSTERNESPSPGSKLHQNQRAVVIMNQASPKKNVGQAAGPSGGAERASIVSGKSNPTSHLQRSFINDDIFRQATDEETNYMKFILNEMKPNYHTTKNNGSMVQGSHQKTNFNTMAAAAMMFKGATGTFGMTSNEKSLQQIPKTSLTNIRTHSLIELEDGAIGLVAPRQPLMSADQTSGIESGVLFLNNDVDDEVEGSSYLQKKKSFRNDNYSLNQLQRKQPLRAQSQSNQRQHHQLNKKQGKVQQQNRGETSIERARSQQRQNTMQQKQALPIMQDKAVGASCQFEEQNEKEQVQNEEENIASSGGGGVASGGGATGNNKIVSDRQSLDSSNYKTIKFKLMIMKSPKNGAKLQKNGVLVATGYQNESGGDRHNNRIVGGRESSKNFRHELKRYPFVDTISGTPQGHRKEQIQQLLLTEDIVRPVTVVQEKRKLTRLNSKFEGIRGASITMLGQLDGTIALNTGLDLFIRKQLTAEHLSQDTIINSSAAPLSKKMSAKYKSRQPHMNNSKGAQRITYDLKPTSSNAPTVVPFLSEEFFRNDNIRYNDASKPTFGPTNEDPVLTFLNDKFQQLAAGVDLNKIMETEESPLKPKSPPIPKYPQSSGTEFSPFSAKTLSPKGYMRMSKRSVDYDIRSGGEIGGGVFSTSRQINSEQNVDEEADEDHITSREKLKPPILKLNGQQLTNENCTITSEDRNKEKRKVVLDLQQKANLKLISGSEHRSRKNKKPKQLNTDLHSMIVPGESKFKPQTQSHQRTADRKDDSIYPNVTVVDVDNQAQNDNLSIESSDGSSDTEKKDISLQVDKPPMEASYETSQIMFMDEQFMRNANYFMKYFDNFKMSNTGNSSMKEGSHILTPTGFDCSIHQNIESPPEIPSMEVGGISLQKGKQNAVVHPQQWELCQYPQLIDHQQPQIPQQTSKTNGKQRILSVQQKNQSNKIKHGNLGEEIIKGRPIKPIKQLIQENLQFLQQHPNPEKIPLQQAHHQHIFIDLQGKPNKPSYIVHNKKQSPMPNTPITEEDGDMNLSKYIKNTIQQFQAEGYSVDLNLLKTDFSEEMKQSESKESERQGFKNKKIKNSYFYHQFKKDVNIANLRNISQRQHGSNKAGARGEPNADLQISFIESKRENTQNGLNTRSQDTLMPQSKRAETDASINQRTDDDNFGNTLHKNGGVDLTGQTFDSHKPQQDPLMINSQAPHDDLAEPSSNLDVDTVMKSPVISFKKLKKSPSPIKERSNSIVKRQGISELMLEQSEGSSDIGIIIRPKGTNLHFDLNLTKIQPPNLPQHLQMQMHMMQPSLNSDTGYQRRMATTQPAMRPGRQHNNLLQNPMTKFTGGSNTSAKPSPVDPSKACFFSGVGESFGGGSMNHVINKFADERMSGHMRDLSLPKNSKTNIAQSHQPPESSNLNDIYLFQDSRRPATDMKGVTEVMIKASEHLRQSQETYSDAFSNSVFYNKPTLLKEIVPVSNVMHLRNKNQKMLATAGVVSPQSRQQKQHGELNEFSGSDVIVKDLNVMRNRDYLRLASHDQQALSPSMRLPQSTKVQDRYAARTTLSSHTQENISNLTTQRFRLQSEMTKRPAPNLTTLMSPLQNNKMRLCTNNNHILSPQINEKNSMFSQKPTFKSARTTQEPRNMGYFLRIKKGRALEDQTSGIKPSNGIKIIS